MSAADVVWLAALALIAGVTVAATRARATMYRCDRYILRYMGMDSPEKEELLAPNAGRKMAEPRPMRGLAAKLPEVTIHLAPEYRLNAVLRWLPVSERSKERVFSQVIGDMRQEHEQAVAAGRERLALAIVARGYVAFLLTLVAFIGSAAVKRVIEIWKLL